MPKSLSYEERQAAQERRKQYRREYAKDLYAERIWETEGRMVGKRGPKPRVTAEQKRVQNAAAAKRYREKMRGTDVYKQRCKANHERYIIRKAEKLARTRVTNASSEFSVQK